MSLVEVFCDFDGTITKGDTTDVLLEELANSAWRDFESHWEQGAIGSRDCMAQQIPLIRGGWQAITKVLDKVELDDSFASFAKWCRQQGIPIRVVSDGIDKVIHYLLAKHNIKVDFVFANRLVESEAGELSLLFPYAITNKKMCNSGVCKCLIANNGRTNPLKVIIGDGRSDFCWAADADILFAKSKLITYARAKNLSYFPFDDFHAIRSTLEERVAAIQHATPQMVPSFS